MDFSKDFFHVPSYLTVSGQLQAEAFACSLVSSYFMTSKYEYDAQIWIWYLNMIDCFWGKVIPIHIIMIDDDDDDFLYWTWTWWIIIHTNITDFDDWPLHICDDPFLLWWWWFMIRVMFSSWWSFVLFYVLQWLFFFYNHSLLWCIVYCVLFSIFVMCDV